MRRALVTLLLLTVILAGCQSNSNTPQRGVAYLGGDTGLRFSFMEQAPPPVVLDEAQLPFSISVLLENVGESDVGVGSANTFGYILIDGIDPQAITRSGNPDELFVTFQEADVSLQSVRRNTDGTIINGGQTVVSFNDLAWTGDVTAEQLVTARAELCYEYRSYANGQICIKDSLLENADDDSICVGNGQLDVSVSGGPVQVTQLRQTMMGQGKVQVSFNVGNVGGGTVYTPYSLAQNPAFVCQTNTGAYLERNNVFASVSIGDTQTQNNYIVNCPQFGGANEGLIRGVNANPQISCTVEALNPLGGRTFTQTLNVDLFYTYNEYIDTPIVIRDANVGTIERAQQ